MMLDMQYSKTGYDLTKQFEGCRLEAYQDGGGVWTIGFGHTHHVREGDVITQDQADGYLMADISDAQDAVNDYVEVRIAQGMYDALVDFTFNCGVNAFKTSTLLKKLNRGDFSGACDELDRWVYDNGVRIAGLARRRDAEQEMFKGDA